MAEYIERESALEECDWYANEFCECEYAIMPLKGALENLPAADVRPVVKAAWEDTPNPQWPAHSIRYCPCCGWSIPKSKLRAKDLERSKEYETFWEKEANEALKKFQVAIASMPRWIPVTERLPDVFKHVLVNIPGMAPHPTVQEAFCEKNGMWYSNGFRYGADEITHWMPLPEPPEEET